MHHADPLLALFAGEIAAGCAIGSSVLSRVAINESLELFSEIGAVLLLLSVGASKPAPTN